jgi:ribose 5-phosphate isomerase A
MVSVPAMSPEEAKRQAARAAIEELPEAGTIGLGSGSTARLFIDEVGALVARGHRFDAVPTSEDSRAQALALGIPVLGDEGPWDILVTVDGADEVDAALNLIKGGGAAHTREKIVNHASRRNVIIVDSTKVSRRLGEKRSVPVEVLRFGHLSTRKALSALGRAELRVRGDGPVLTDTGNLIYDLSVGPMADPEAVDRAIRAVPGVVETGLFLGRADLVLVAGGDGVRRLERPST